MTRRPWLWFIAGPNGAGKTTRGMRFLTKVKEIVRPDEIALRFSPSAPEEAALSAGREAILLTRRLLKERHSFAIETTLSGRGYIYVVRKALSERWNVGLIYVGVESPEIAIRRVSERYAAGGHNVPPEDIARRYDRSLANLPIFLELATHAIVFDNSTEQGAVRVLEMRKRSRVFVQTNPPNWIRPILHTVSSRKSRRKPRS
jgi:predicted ABC-type ATPase